MASPTSLNCGTNSKERIILITMPMIAEYSICLSFEKALNIWKPNIEERLTIKINGAVICSGRIALSKLVLNNKCTISWAHKIKIVTAGIEILIKTKKTCLIYSLNFSISPFWNNPIKLGKMATVIALKTAAIRLYFKPDG